MKPHLRAFLWAASLASLSIVGALSPAFAATEAELARACDSIRELETASRKNPLLSGNAWSYETFQALMKTYEMRAAELSGSPPLPCAAQAEALKPFVRQAPGAVACRLYSAFANSVASGEGISGHLNMSASALTELRKQLREALEKSETLPCALDEARLAELGYQESCRIQATLIEDLLEREQSKNPLSPYLNGDDLDPYSDYLSLRANLPEPLRARPCQEDARTGASTLAKLKHFNAKLQAQQSLRALQEESREQIEERNPAAARYVNALARIDARLRDDTAALAAAAPHLQALSADELSREIFINFKNARDNSSLGLDVDTEVEAALEQIALARARGYALPRELDESKLSHFQRLGREGSICQLIQDARKAGIAQLSEIRFRQILEAFDKLSPEARTTLPCLRAANADLGQAYQRFACGHLQAFLATRSSDVGARYASYANAATARPFALPCSIPPQHRAAVARMEMDSAFQSLQALISNFEIRFSPARRTALLAELQQTGQAVQTTDARYKRLAAETPSAPQERPTTPSAISAKP